MNSHSHNIEAFQLGRSLLHDATGHIQGWTFLSSDDVQNYD